MLVVIGLTKQLTKLANLRDGDRTRRRVAAYRIPRVPRPSLQAVSVGRDALRVICTMSDTISDADKVRRDPWRREELHR